MAVESTQVEATQNGHGANCTTFAVENPATGETIANLPDLDAAAVKSLVDRARAAQPAWESIGFHERAKYMFRMRDRKSTRLNSSHANISYAVFCLKKKPN